MQLKLVVEIGPHQGTTFSTNEPGIWQIGRLKSAHLALPDDKFTSRKHCAIEFSPKGALLLDVGGRSGTYVNGQRVKQTPLNDGDIIWIGGSVIQVHIAGVQPSTIAVPHPTGISGFTMVKQLPNDGPGEAWLAYANRAQQIVTVHFLDQVKLDREQQQRFLREAGICSRLHHPNLVRFLGQGVTDNITWFVTEIVEGKSLSQYIMQRGPISVDQALAIIIPVMEVMAYLHKQDIIHRSLHPSSLIVNKAENTFRVQIADLGSAKCFQEFQPVTILGECGFAIHPYTAPELLIDFRTLNPRSDIYALGGILYFMLSGQPLYQMSSDQDRMKLILDADPLPIGILRPDLPPNLIEVIDRATAKDMNIRYNTVEEMQEALRGNDADWKEMGLPPHMYTHLRSVLLKSGIFQRSDTLEAIFIDTRIRAWHNTIPEAQNAAQRVSKVINWLSSHKNQVGENALVLLLHVLCDHISPEDALHQQLTTIANELEKYTQ